MKKAWGGVGSAGRRGSGGIAVAGGVCRAQVTYRRWELRAKWESENMLKWLLKIPLPLPSTLANIYVRAAFFIRAGINPAW